MHLENLRTVNNQVSEPSSCSEKFTDDNTDKGETDIYFHRAQNGRNAARKDNLKKSVPFAAAQRINQSDFFAVYLLKAGVKAYDGAKYGNGCAGNNNGSGTGAEPYDKKRRKRGFRQTV